MLPNLKVHVIKKEHSDWGLSKKLPSKVITIHLLTRSFNRYLLSNYYVSGTVLGAQGTE